MIDPVTLQLHRAEYLRAYMAMPWKSSHRRRWGSRRLGRRASNLWAAHMLALVTRKVG